MSSQLKQYQSLHTSAMDLAVSGQPESRDASHQVDEVSRNSAMHDDDDHVE